MNIAIAGASGFIGKHLLRHYADAGDRVCAITSNPESLSAFRGATNVQIVYASYEDYDKLAQRAAVRDLDVFYYLSWMGYGAATNEYAVQIRNIKPVCDAISEAAKLGCRRFVFSSSFYEYMVPEQARKSHDEGACCSVYGSAKHAARILAQAVAARKGIEFISVAFANTFGPGDQSKRATNYFIRQLLNGRSLDLTEGKHLYDWNYIDDCVRGLVLAGEKGAPDAVYYLGSNERRPLKEIVSDVRDIIAPNAEIRLGVYKDDFHVDYRCVDTQKLYRDTGYLAKADFRSAIWRTAEWVKTMPWD